MSRRSFGGQRKFGGRGRFGGSLSSSYKKNGTNLSEAEKDAPLDIESTMSESNENRFRRAKANEIIDCKYGFENFSGPGERLGWLINTHPTDILDESKNLVSAVDFYFLQSDGSRFKVSRAFLPYFYVSVMGDRGVEAEVTTFLSRKYAGRITKIDFIEKEDLDMPNHLMGIKARYLKLSFNSVDELTRVRREIASRVKANREIQSLKSSYTDMLGEHFAESTDMSSGYSKTKMANKAMDALDYLNDIREYDVPYLMRVCIDLNVFAAHWYTVKCRPSQPPEFIKSEETVAWPEPVVLAFDIETTKLPLKFPDSAIDQIMMISYMIDGMGYLICNQEIIAEDIEDFEFTPRPEFPGYFRVLNVVNEEALIKQFFDHILRVKPTILVTYNGDSFDWPFLEARAAHYGLKMSDEIGFNRELSGPSVGRDPSAADYLCRPAVHMDCFRWVKRDSYLPVGAQGLKAVAKAKLHYDPVEMDPELMCRMAREEPRTLANYSVSDAVATYYLYMKYVHPFVFALCTILPLNPDDVLRKGSGTLCEALLMVQAYEANVIFPHKQSGGSSSHDAPQGILGDSLNSYSFTDDNRLIDSETYVGGHVEALEAGVFRADIPVRFRLVPAALEKLRADARRCLCRAISTELDTKDPSVVESLIEKKNFEQVCAEVEQALGTLGAMPNRVECPVIVHLDVGAMYPNIILTNRLQPSAVAADASERCSSCHFYKPGVACQRFMSWKWRGELWTASRAEVYRVQAQLNQERFPDTKMSESGINGGRRAFHELSREEQATVEKKRLSDFCRRAYKRIHTTRTEERVAMVCQRENSFYVDTVRSFRDRRYKFKGLTKVWKRKLDETSAAAAAGVGDPALVKEASSMVVLYDSLQLAHKCILNSFYGYVMRRGARWHSMEMAGIVCHTGASIITRARELVEQIGRSLELDTDGIWCMLPASFPQNLQFQLASGKKLSVSYPGAVLNQLVQDLFTNDQYHELLDPAHLTYTVRSENSIFFEIDGPYKAMVLPAAKEEGKRLKKRYAVFNFDGSLAELKGFEVKRNGELQLIKIFQSSVFEAFLRGRTLTEIYASVAKVADHWLDVLYSHGVGMPDSELFDLIAENRSMSRKLADYGSQKSTSISTAKRLAEFLGDSVVKEARLACRFIIARQPEQAPVTERAIPLAIFQAEPSVKHHFLRKWLKDSSLSADVDIRSILDWNYYIERLGSAIQKIITIPAALQQVNNPVPRVPHPDWLLKRLAEKTDTCRQSKLTDLFAPAVANSRTTLEIEDIGDTGPTSPSTSVPRATRLVSPPQQQQNAGGRKRSAASALPKPVGPPPAWRESLGQPPALNEDSGREEIQAWLAFHQKKWQLQAERRKYMAALGDVYDSGGGNGPLLKRPRGLTGFLTRTRVALKSAIWQIIEVVPNIGHPGQYTLWVLLRSHFGNEEAGQLYPVRLTVPRRFYVNVRVAKPQDSGAFYHKVSISGISSTSAQDGQTAASTSHHTLPRNHPVHHLYEYNLPEDVFNAHMADIAADLAHPEVEGVYELHVPSLFRLLVRLGCLCAVTKRLTGSESTTTTSDSFSLEQLEFRSLAQHAYLPRGSLRSLFLFHYQDDPANPRRQIYLLVVPWARRAHVCVVDTARVNQLRGLEALYRKQRPRATALTVAQAPMELSFETQVETQATVARRAVQRWITTALQEKRQMAATEAGGSNAAPVVLLLHAPFLTANRQQAPGVLMDALDAPWPLGERIVGRRRSPQIAALAELPVIPIGGSLEESEGAQQLWMGDGAGDEEAATSDAYGILNWQQTVATRGIKYFLQSEIRLEHQLELARYLHVPVGNVPVADAPPHVSLTSLPSPTNTPATPLPTVEFGCDLFYARHLIKQNHILWVSATGRPDFGGKEVDDQRLMLEMEESTVVEINRKGFYRQICVDFEFTNLAVNTMLVASRIPELEGASALTFDRLVPAQQSIEEQLSRGVNVGAQITDYDETAACSAAFRVLRTMVVGWVKDVTQYQNALADEQVINFYHWLRSSSSLFYDPALRRTLQKLMKKVFLKLVDELNQSHGLDVIFASYSRLVLCTHRFDVADALSRADSLLKLLRSKALFVHLDLQYSCSWYQLLWYDTANYAGLKVDLEALDAEAERKLEDSTTKEAEFTVDMSWHIARYLPETRGLRAKFQTLVAGYLLATNRAVNMEAKRLVECGVSLSQPPPPSAKTPDSSFQDENAPPVIGNADASLSPGVLDFLDSLVREQLAPELYGFVQRLKRKAGSWCPTSDMTTSAGGRQLRRRYTPEDIAAYLDEKPELGEEMQGDEVGESAVTRRPPPPLLPPHPAEYSASLTPIMDFVRSLCEVFSLDCCIARQVADMRRDLLRLLGVGEFSKEAAWVPPYITFSPEVTDGRRSLLVYLPEVTCSTCNSIRDLDVCRDTHLTFVPATSGGSGYWLPICPHCGSPYPRSKLEAGLISQVEQTVMQFTLQDLRCPNCVVGGGIQESVLAKGGSVGRCVDCASPLELTVASGQALSRRLAVFSAIGRCFNLRSLEQTANWLGQGQLGVFT
uniref:DNA-directed DNA polymerase n=2 Tax=Schistocephalus solidus TaxID=70667 RepID=A0A0X3P616_SCHSO